MPYFTSPSGYGSWWYEAGTNPYDSPYFPQQGMSPRINAPGDWQDGMVNPLYQERQEYRTGGTNPQGYQQLIQTGSAEDLSQLENRIFRSIDQTTANPVTNTNSINTNTNPSSSSSSSSKYGNPSVFSTSQSTMTDYGQYGELFEDEDGNLRNANGDIIIPFDERNDRGSNPPPQPESQSAAVMNFTRNGQYTRSMNVAEIGQLINEGWTPLKMGSVTQPATVEEFQGGLLIDGMPINTFITGEISPEQVQALQQAGRTVEPNWRVVPMDQQTTFQPGPNPIPGMADQATPDNYQPDPNSNVNQPGGSGGGGGTGGGGTGGSGFPTNTRDGIRYLIQQSLNRIPGADALFGNIGNFATTLTQMMMADRELRDNLLPALIQPGEFERGLRSLLDNTLQQRDRQVSRTLEPALGEFTRAIGERERGLSPETLRALESELTAGIPGQFKNAAADLTTALQRRGAIGTQLPSSSGDIVRQFAPLYAQRAEALSSARRQTVLEDERATQQSRDRALQAAQGSAGLVGVLGNIYNPQPILEGTLGAERNRLTALQALGQILDPSAFIGGVNNAFTGQSSALQAGTNALNTAMQGTQGLVDLEPASFKNMLLSAILGAVTSPGSGQNGGSLIGDAIGSIWDLFRGGNNNGSGGVNINFPDINSLPLPRTPAPSPLPPVYNPNPGLNNWARGFGGRGWW